MLLVCLHFVEYVQISLAVPDIHAILFYVQFFLCNLLNIFVIMCYFVIFCFLSAVLKFLCTFFTVPIIWPGTTDEKLTICVASFTVPSCCLSVPDK